MLHGNLATSVVSSFIGALGTSSFLGLENVVDLVLVTLRVVHFSDNGLSLFVLPFLDVESRRIGPYKDLKENDAQNEHDWLNSEDYTPGSVGLEQLFFLIRR